MARRKKNEVSRYDLIQIDLQARTPTLEAMYPLVKRVIVDVFERPEDPLGGGPRSWQRTFERGQRAWFKFPCRYEVTDNCVRGGLDLSGSVREAIESQRNLVEGSVSCRGKQGGDSRPGNHTCLLPMDFKIFVEYV